MKILYAHTHAPSYVRTEKFIRSLTDSGHEVYFFGAQRVKAAVASEPFGRSVNVEISSRKMSHGFRSIVALLFYLFRLRKLAKTKNPDVILVTNEELMLAFLGRNKSSIVVLDAIDSLAFRTSAAGILQQCLLRVSSWARGKADLVIEVEDFRAAHWKEISTATVVVRNTPAMTSIPLKLPSPKENTAAPFVYVSGSLNKQINGIEVLLESFKFLENSGLEVVVAGTFGDEDVEYLVAKSEYCRYVGAVSVEESLRLAQSSVAVFAYYKPYNWNFRHAAPNKVYEAMALGMPVLVNSEAKISMWAERSGFGLTASYDDPVELAQNILKAQKFDSSSELKVKLEEEFRKSLCWERQYEKVANFLNSIDAEAVGS